jgi:large subunit ribosomal protein L29
MKAQKIREMSDKQISEKVKELRMDLLKERFLRSTNQQKNPLKKRGIRKDIARMLTILKEKQNGKS